MATPAAGSISATPFAKTLPAKDGKPTRVLVGHYDGCTLFELVPSQAEKGAITGTKIFTGHGGEVK